MTWFDLLVLLLVGGLVLYETRMEAGRGLLDAVVALAALHLAGEYAGPLTSLLHLRPLGETGVAPGAYALLFIAVFAGGIAVAHQIHRLTRWSMDPFDSIFGVVFGVIVGVAVGHAFTDITARFALMHYGAVPDFVQHSFLGEELRSFKTYHFVLDTFQAYQYGE